MSVYFPLYYCGNHLLTSASVLLSLCQHSIARTFSQLKVKQHLQQVQVHAVFSLSATWTIEICPAYLSKVGSWGCWRWGECFSCFMEENNRVRDNKQGPPVKVISKWKAPSKIINRIIVCHFAPKNRETSCHRTTSCYLILVFDWTPFVFVRCTVHINGNRMPLRFNL